LEPIPTISIKEEKQFSSDYSEQSDDDYEPQPKKRMQRQRSTSTRRNNNNTNYAVKSEPAKGKRRGNMKNDYDGLPANERQRLIVRRERNKQAAARCRQRREDLTQSLMDQVKMWENKKEDLAEQIRQLKSQKQELEYILQIHKETCSLNVSAGHIVAVKSEPGVIVEPVNAPYMEIEEKRRRPASLSIPFSSSFAMEQSGPEGVLIETPSTVIPSFESFLNGSTGLTPVNTMSAPNFYTSSNNSNNFLNTPVVPSCSIQQRSSEVPDLNTPGETVSLVSL